AARLLSHPVDKDPGVTYDAEAKLELLRPLGIAARPRPMHTALGRGRREEFAQMLGAAMVVNPGARKIDHRWDPAGFAQAAREISAGSGLTPWVSWGPGEEALAREVAERAGARLLPATDLEGLAAAFRCAALVIANDTGPMHLAVAVGAPTVAIFLSADARRWLSPEPNLRAVQAGGMPLARAVEQVVAAATELLAARA